MYSFWISCCSLSVAGRFESGGIAVSEALDVAVVERLMVDVLVAGRRDRSGESFECSAENPVCVACRQPR